MSVKVYNQNPTELFQNAESFVYRYFEYVLLIFVALTGILCSGIALAENSSQPNLNFDRQIAALTHPTENNFDDHVKILGDKKADSELTFEVNVDYKNKRFVMEMGDGNRMIITQPKFNYTYHKKDVYLLELKEIQRGLIITIGEKKVKIQ